MPPRAGQKVVRSPQPPRTGSTKSPSPSLELNVAFYIFFASHLVAALYAPIQDCDEVFNYWEPTHYLNHGSGLQTWEYSPEYAIRSWTYAGIHASVIGIWKMVPFSSKYTEFYFLRIVLALVCALCETRLFSTITRTINPRVAMFFLMIMAFSPGMFHASAAYLPSSFAMYTTMLGFSAFMDWRGGLRTAQGMFWFAFGGLVGWPFSTALVLPFLVEEAVLAGVTGQVWDAFRRVLDGTARSFIVLILQLCIDSFFMRKLAFVPFNIVWYNVFSGSGKGPDIYGTEPWHFYVRNLILNFNVWFILAIGAIPLLFFQHSFRRQSTTRQTLLRGLVFVSPFYLWLGIFTLQPHKEERFMYPAYPALALNAAMSLHILLAYFGSSDPRDLASKIPAQLKLAFVSVIVLGAIDFGGLRTIGMLTAYSAPLKVYKSLQRRGMALPGDTVCLGKEWYRFPSSYHLPNKVKAKFIKSEFSGLLPGEFSEANVGFGLYPGAWLTPPGMNDENKEDLSKYIDVDHCTFLVDSHFPGTTPTEHEPAYVLDTDNWEKVSCESFLDTAQTSTVGRLLWIPDLPIIPERHRRKWGQYCLLRRKIGSSQYVPPQTQCYLAAFRDLFELAQEHWMLGSCRQPRYIMFLSCLCFLLINLQYLCALHSILVSDLRTLSIMDNVKLWARHNCHPEHVKTAAVHLQQRIKTDPNPFLYGLLTLLTAIWVSTLAIRRFRTWRIPTRPGTPDLEKPSSSKFKAAAREPGVWIPHPFKRPTAAPYPDWSLTATKPLPYRPFRYGPKYNVTMGLRTMHWDDWIELDNHYPKFHALKAERIVERGTKCCYTAPEAFDGAVELLEELCDYLPQRYPSLYRKTDVGLDNLETGESFNVVDRPLKEDPMQMSARLVQDDLAIMFERPNGQYYLLAGAILLAGFWRLEDKFGMPLSEIHTSGDVPQYKEKLEKGMLNFFKRVMPDKAVLRNNYFIQVDDELAWSSSIGGEDSDGIGWFTAEKNKAIEHHWFRSERQSLRRLPRSGGVVFTIRTYFHPITEICEEPYVPGRLASAVRSWGDDVSKYKGKERYQDVLLEYLDRKHEEQVANGLDMEKEDDVRSYPY
ncbi:uncharacterized protein BDZ99DRAFT_455419 [Mytilinidion resinicola]|uniref:Mannosyltransferase n=1 Tax=Mytilinidion resinicola TaxID=574789 RepID=A0A6A6XZK4_9PEZI|nr:uncharacterized protein BDZ99DRAFT_455419 [Mytilinidion resinicola]KAF2801952.1 hypothetical protein BDZ99DRAFT_455419 [Mytilinidion resinicola]